MKRYCTQCGKITTKKNVSLFVCAAGHEDWLNPALGAVVYVVKNGKVLYGVRSIGEHAGKLSLPGGFVEVDETAEHAAIREVKEELGVDVTLLTCLGTYTTTYDGRPNLNIVFVANCESKQITPADDMNGGDPVWRAYDDLPSVEEVAWDWYGAVREDFINWQKHQT